MKRANDDKTDVLSVHWLCAQPLPLKDDDEPLIRHENGLNP
ncbi:hypothetical protein ACOXVJ_07035 [Pseudomonas knackmussii]